MVSSVHKTLGSLTASALINVSKNSRLSPVKVKDAYHILATTSPSPMLLADVESCVRVFKDSGELLLENAIALNTKLRDSLKMVPEVVIGDFSSDFEVDPTKTIFKI